MKKVAVGLMVCFYVMTGICSAQVTRNVPSAVLTAFNTKYPGKTHVTWAKDGVGYAARFYDVQVPCTVRFNNNGEWLDETRKLSFGDLRSNVKNAFSQSKFASWHAYEVNEIQEKNKEKQYRILIRDSGAKGKYIYYDTKGQLTKEALTI